MRLLLILTLVCSPAFAATIDLELAPPPEATAGLVLYGTCNGAVFGETLGVKAVHPAPTSVALENVEKMRTCIRVYWVYADGSVALDPEVAVVEP